MSLIKVESVCKSYGSTPILRDVSFVLEEGERVGLMGPSGSGKSTLLNCLGAIDRPDSGSILVAGEALEKLDSVSMARVRRETISTIFQFFHLLPTLTARENIEFPLQLLGVSGCERAERVERLLEQVSLAHRADALPSELSGGEMQRVAIARALVTQPRLILADEPTGNLDSSTGEVILDLIEELTDEYNTGLILVTHSEAATRICRRVLHMVDGQLTEAPAKHA